MEVKRREGETSSAFLYRFGRKVRHSGVLREVRKRQRKKRPISKINQRLTAIHRDKKKKELEKAKRLGIA